MSKARKASADEIRGKVIALEAAISRAYAQFEKELPILQAACPHEAVTTFYSHDLPTHKCPDCLLESKTRFGKARPTLEL
jgi:hypothetical protein